MQSDAIYLQIMMEALDVCRTYKPMLGHGGEGYSLSEFDTFYGADPFYSWIGLNSPLVYAAHKAAGGITSIYRQIGIGCERLFRQIIADSLGLSDKDSCWSYTLPSDVARTKRRLTLDARIPVEAIADPERKKIVTAWMLEAGETIGLRATDMRDKRGAVFEVRQGYKSKDSKRQNADITNAANAYAYGYIPVICVFSLQIDKDLLKRYRDNRILVLVGSTTGTKVSSTYRFCHEVLGYDLAAFFERNSSTIREKVAEILQRLLSPHD